MSKQEKYVVDGEEGETGEADDNQDQGPEDRPQGHYNGGEGNEKKKDYNAPYLGIFLLHTEEYRKLSERQGEVDDQGEARRVVQKDDAGIVAVVGKKVSAVR